ncbi:MAG: hypothetical protein H7199_08265 [Burkholderiales bacterium]|nr:hypothetical protein [Flavobacterium sp.]
MDKFLRKCAFFLILLVLLNGIYLLVLGIFSPGFKKVYEISKFRNQSYKLLVLGNSMALDAIDAQYLSQRGLDSYNLAVAGDHVSTSLMLLEEYLQNNKKPEVVLIGLSSAIGQSYLNKVPFKNPEVEFFYHPNWKANITSPPLLNFQWLFVDLLKIIISKDHRNAQLVRGQWKTKKVIPDHSVFKEMTHKNTDYKDPYLSKIIGLCQKNGIKVILVELPGANSNRNSLPFTFQAKKASSGCITVYNLNSYEIASKIIDPEKDWLAPDHLNQFGGQKITKFLLEHIIKK